MTPSHPRTTRRTFLKHGSVALTAPGVLSGPRTPDDTLRVGLVGCGGRGTGAAGQALATAGPVRLVAMADAFEDRLESSLASLTEQMKERKTPERVDVPKERRFLGFEGFARAIDSDVDVVILATPPGFRPQHFEHAVERGRHVFLEKPVAVDGPGVRQVLAAAQAAKQQDLKVGVGLQRHHDPRYVETVARIRDGAIGDLILLRCYWNSAGVWDYPRQPGMTEMEYQMRNWYYFNWLCGDHIVEQHIHNLDVCNWIKDAYPARAQGQGGRQVRAGRDHGEIYDHHMVEYTYADGMTMLSQCRHIAGCWNSVSEWAHGSAGSAHVSGWEIESPTASWSVEQEGVDPFQLEHDSLFAAIRENRPYDEAENGARSTLTAIMGRMATYSGKPVLWDDALSSDLRLAPSEYSWKGTPPTTPDAQGRYPIPTPGVTRAL